MLKRFLVGFVSIFLLIAIGFPVYLAFFRTNHIHPREVAKSKYAHIKSHFFSYKGKEIHYIDQGKGQPILMIHGFMGSQRNFESLAVALQDSFRIIRVDIPGFGLSEFFQIKPNEKPDLKKLYNDFFAFFMDSMKLDSVHLIGNSMGGMMCWYMAANYPQRVRSLTLLNPAGYDMLNVLDKAAPILQYPILEPFMRRGLPLDGAKENLKVCYANDSLVPDGDVIYNNAMHNTEGNLQAAFKVAGSGQHPDTNLIKTIACSTLIIWGKEDEIIPFDHAERFHRDIRNSELIAYSPCGHVPMLERTSDVKRDFLAFIRSKKLLAKN